MRWIKSALIGAEGLAAFAAAFCWYYSASVPIGDSQDSFISDLQSAAEWSGYGAAFAVVAAGLHVVALAPVLIASTQARP